MDVTIVTRDGARLGVPCAEGQNVLAGAEEAGLYLPSMCREGSCGMCAAHVTEGAYEMGACAEGALPKGEGGVLLCRCLALSDLVVEVPVRDEQIGRHRVPERRAVIAGLVPAGAGALAVTLQLEADETYGAAADFVPGQFFEMTLPGADVRRAYSLANLPNWDGRLEFIIRLVPGGRFSGWLAAEARVGQMLELRGPMGHFALDEASPRPRVLVAGGCGVAPILSLLRQMAEYGDATPVHLIYGANREAEFLPPHVLAEMKAALPQLDVTYAVWHPEAGWNGFVGTAAEALSVVLASGAAVPDIYVCGPPRMLEAVEGAALAAGVPAAQFFAERVQS
ncbi:2Fe-2S iron-sulfur cluster binding domain-containing protein [Acidocella sp.]|uniref:2Fe-2S iron-sulfur cluster binding domain-containing protein n=1 Tax=Acidocella sp. TaxID=50710 RepID=UPI0026386322|nr:2Fe-2S iron-sulfur cluster binding domain-containing protein [Acidocella sp.]